METEPKPAGLKRQLDQEALKKITRDLTAAFDSLAADFRQNTKLRAEAQEVGAMFELYRRHRGVNEGEALARLRAAIAEYDTEHLANLITFGQFLARECQPVWDHR